MNNLKKLTILSLKNIRSHKWLYIRIAVAFAGILFMVSLFLSYTYMLSETQVNMKNKSISANYFISNEKIDELNDAECLELKYYNFVKHVNEWFNVSSNYLSAGKVNIVLDGITYTNLEGYEWKRIEVYAGPYLITNNDLKELYLRYDKKTCITGYLPQNENEILVSELFLEYYGLSSNILGQVVTMYANDEDTHIILDSVKICGIICSEFFSLDGHTVPFLAPSLFLSPENSLFEDTDCVNTYYLYSPNTWLSKERINDLVQRYSCDFIGSYVLKNVELVEKMQVIALNLFIIIGVSIGLGFILMIILMMDKLVTFFSRDGGILLACGMDKKELQSLLYIILLWVCSFSVVLAFGFTLVMCIVINSVINSLYFIGLTVSFSTMIKLFLFGLVCMIIIASIFYIFAIRKINKKTVKELLSSL